MGKNEYEAAEGALFSQKKVQIYGEYIEQLIEEREGELITSSELVDVARDIQAPIHEYFEWDDTIAGAKYRNYQARNLINHIIKVNPTDNKIKEKAFFSVKVTIEENEKHKIKYAYTTQEHVLTNDEFRQQILNSAIKQIEHWHERYETFKELNKIFSAIALTKKELDLERQLRKIEVEDTELKKHILH